MDSDEKNFQAGDLRYSGTVKRIATLLGLLSFALCALAAEIPRKAPELGIALPDGRILKTSDYLGKVVVFAFILTT